MDRISYVKKILEESGIDFKKIPRDKILMTCKNYNGIISRANYNAVLNAINEIYKSNNSYGKLKTAYR